MELWTVSDKDFSIEHLEKCPIWGSYEIEADKKYCYEPDWMEPDEVMLALNNNTAWEEGYGPFFIAAIIKLNGGIKCKGLVVISDFDWDVYNVTIWTGKQFCRFNKHFHCLSDIKPKVDSIGKDMGIPLTNDYIFPIHFEINVSKEYIDHFKSLDFCDVEASSDEFDLKSKGTFELMK